jgi:ABC-type transporter Mla subunit MlaD
LLGAVEAMKKQPEKLTVGLDTLFRLQAVEAQVNSLLEGVRRYQNPAVGDLLVSVVSANSGNRDKLRQYITDLAQTKEEEFQVVDREAQRCRGTLMRQPPARPSPAAPKPAAATRAAPEPPRNAK